MHQKTVLDNGLRVVSATMPHTRSVSTYFFIGVGSRYETDPEAGISHFIEHLLFRGTQRRPLAKDVSEAIEGVGGTLNGGTDREMTLYWARVPQTHFKLCVDVLADIYRNSKFEPGDIEKERQIIIEEINMTKDSPHQQVHALIDELLWPEHPLGRDIAGTKETVGGITRDMMLGYLENKYLPENTVIAVAGNIEHAEVVGEVERAFSGWKNSRLCPEFVPWQEPKNPRIMVEKRDTEQAHFCLALPGLPLLHPDRYGMDILNVVLGEGMSSRLFTEIRDKLGLAYSIHSYTDHLHDSGAQIIYAGVEPGNLALAVKSVVGQLALMHEPISDAEISKARELSRGRLMLRMEDTRSVAGWLGGQEVLTGQILTVDEVISRVDAISIDQIQRIAREIITGDKLRLAVVGPVSDEKGLDSLLSI